VCDILVQPVEELNWGEPTSFVDTIEQRCGGSAASTARTLAILGVPVRLLSAVGRDNQARFVLEVIRLAGVDTEHVSRDAGRTACTVALVNSCGDRKFFHRCGPAVGASGIDPTLYAGMAHFHLCGVFVTPGLREQAPELLKSARAAGLRTSFDTNWDPRQRWLDTLEPCLPSVNLLFMNEVEAVRITGQTEPRLMARWAIARGVPTCVLKLGARGCAIYTDDVEILCPAFEVEARDTTGAGDCFAGGFLSALHRGASLAEAGLFANAVAAMSVEQVGAVEGVRSAAETEAWMRRTPQRKATANV